MLSSILDYLFNFFFGPTDYERLELLVTARAITVCRVCKQRVYMRAGRILPHVNGLRSEAVHECPGGMP